MVARTSTPRKCKPWTAAFRCVFAANKTAKFRVQSAEPMFAISRAIRRVVADLSESRPPFTLLVRHRQPVTTKSTTSKPQVKLMLVPPAISTSYERVRNSLALIRKKSYKGAANSVSPAGSNQQGSFTRSSQVCRQTGLNSESDVVRDRQWRSLA